MKTVRASSLGACDICGSPGCGVYNAPLRADAKILLGVSHAWADMCGPCFQKYGVDSSVTEQRVLDPTPPPEVNSIAARWGGPRSTVTKHADGVWRFAEVVVPSEEGGSGPAYEGYVYLVYEPGVPFPLKEDSGRPSGEERYPDDWTVRAINDAPDGWFQVGRDGTYKGHGPEVKVW